MKPILLPFLALATLSPLAYASSPAAWADYDKAVIASCTQASQLKNVKAAAAPAQFDDRVGYTALLLQGKYPQAHMKNRTGRELCLYNKQSKAAFVTEWDAVIPAPKN